VQKKRQKTDTRTSGNGEQPKTLKVIVSGIKLVPKEPKVGTEGGDERGDGLNWGKANKYVK